MARAQLDHKFQPKCRGNTTERVETRSAATRFKTRDRRLRAPNSPRQLRLRDAHSLARLPHVFRQLEGFLRLPIASKASFARDLRDQHAIAVDMHVLWGVIADPPIDQIAPRRMRPMTALPLPLLDIVEHLNRVVHHELRRRNLTSLRVHTASPLFEPTSSLKSEPHQGTGLWRHLSTFDYRLPTAKFFGSHLDRERATGFEPATSSLGSWHSTAELRPQELRRQAPQTVRKSCRRVNALGVRVSV